MFRRLQLAKRPPAAFNSPVDPSTASSYGHFPPTIWTQVFSAGGDTSPDALVAFERLARAYWPPLHAWLLRQGVSREEAAEIGRAHV